MNRINEFPQFHGKKVLFLAETKYQLINCINIAYHIQNRKCDLYVEDFYKNSRELVDKIAELNLFHQTGIHNSDFSKYRKAMYYLNVKRIVQKVFGEFEYDVVFFASRNFIARCVVTYCKCYSPSTHLISYDEGLGTYISRMEDYTNSVEKIIGKYFYHINKAFITDKMLYKPEAYIGDADNIMLFKMPQIDSQVVKMVNRLFDYKPEMQINSNFIFFDEYFDGKDNYRKAIIQALIKITNNQLMIKMHPRTAEGAYALENQYRYSNMPYEIIAANDNNLEGRTLITNASTAVWTPMLLFQKYPRIILLHPLFGPNAAVDVIEKMIPLYQENRIIIVRTFDELLELQF